MIAVTTDGHSRVNPSESSARSPTLSHTPATTRIAQAYCLIVFLLELLLNLRHTLLVPLLMTIFSCGIC